jgi:hypothetical protein
MIAGNARPALLFVVFASFVDQMIIHEGHEGHEGLVDGAQCAPYKGF